MYGLMLTAIVFWFSVGVTPGQTQRRFDVWQLFAPSSYVGLGIMDIDNEKAESIGLIEPHGVEVTNVDEASPAGRAGLKRGDILLTYRGVRVEGIEHFARLVRETPVGREVELGLSRDGNERTIQVKIGERSRNMVNASGECEGCRLVTLDMPRPRITFQSRVLGAELEALEGQLAAFFGAPKGVLVRSVNRQSRAESAGFKAGDVILSVGGKPVAQVHDISRALASANRGSVSVEVLRERQKQTLALEQIASGRLGMTRRVGGSR